MRNYLRLLCGLLTLCLLAVPVCPAARAAETGRTITLEGMVDMRDALKDAQDGDTVVLSGNVTITDSASNDAPWVIDKAVTIRGGTLVLRPGGIVLDADVTFRDTTLSFQPFVRNAIMANGHTLTLENVSCSGSARSVNLFCGGLYDPIYSGAPGTAGAVIIKGSTSLKGDGAPGNLYAGNLCMGGMTEADSAINGPANQYAGSASILIESSGATLGNIYAGGAQQRIPEGSASGKVILTDPAQYTTAGPVDVSLTGGAVKSVDGAGANEIHVTYNGTANSTGLTVKNVSGLRVATGALAPAAESGFSESMALAVAEGAKLDLTGLGNVTVGSLEGGGTLLLGQPQSLAVTGSVTGTTTVGIGALNAGGYSTTPPITDHSYISAPQSGEDAFRLAPPEGSDMQLARAENGDWSVPAGEAPVLVKAFRFETDAFSIPIGEPSCDLPMEVSDGNDDFMYIDDIPVTIRVNGSPANKQQDIFGDDVYITTDDKLSIYLADNTLSVTAAQEDGTYAIEVIIPETHTVSGQPLSARTVLTVGEGGTPPAEPLPYQINNVSASDDQVTVDVSALTADATPGATVLAAAYTQDGRMRAVSMAPMTAAGTVHVPLDSAGADYVTVFIVDDTGALKPLCQNQSAAK